MRKLWSLIRFLSDKRKKKFLFSDKRTKSCVIRHTGNHHQILGKKKEKTTLTKIEEKCHKSNNVSKRACMGAWEQERKHERKRALEHKSAYKRKKKSCVIRYTWNPHRILEEKKTLTKTLGIARRNVTNKIMWAREKAWEYKNSIGNLIS